MELDKRGAELLFGVLTEREERTAIAIASHDSFSGWTKTSTDPRLCAAIVDRLTRRRQHHLDRDQQLLTRPRPQQTQAKWGHFKPSPLGQIELTHPNGTSPAADTRSGSSNRAAATGVVWQSRIYEVALPWVALNQFIARPILLPHKGFLTLRRAQPPNSSEDRG